MPFLSDKFNEKYLTGSKKSRCRKFDPQKIFLCVLHLVSGKNNEGYLHALAKTWDLFGAGFKKMPVKSALTKARSRVSFEFFKDLHDNTIASFEPHRCHWRGVRVYASDGDQHELPRSNDVLQNGFSGYPFSTDRETHYPRMYMVHCYDVNSLTLYDRLHFSKDLVRAHQSSGSYFIARCKSGLTVTEVKEFFKSDKMNASYEVEETSVHLVKVKNPRTGEAMVYATNLPRTKFKNEEISDLYALRWEVETANRDVTDTLKMEQWHSKSMNGILQELYATFWLMNQARIQMVKGTKKACTLEGLFNYEKPNFKLISDFIVMSLKDLVDKKIHRVARRLDELLKRSLERRKRRSRPYPRHRRRAQNQYPLAPKPQRILSERR